MRKYGSLTQELRLFSPFSRSICTCISFVVLQRNFLSLFLPVITVISRISCSLSQELTLSLMVWLYLKQENWLEFRCNCHISFIHYLVSNSQQVYETFQRGLQFYSTRFLFGNIFQTFWISWREKLLGLLLKILACTKLTRLSLLLLYNM